MYRIILTFLVYIIVIFAIKPFSGFVFAKTLNEEFEKIVQADAPEELQEKIEVTRKLEDRDNILLARFQVEGFESTEMASYIRVELAKLLDLRPNVRTLLAENVSGLEVPEIITDYAKFRNRNITYIITGKLTFDQGIFTLKLRVWDVFENKKILEKEFHFLAEERKEFSLKLTTQVYEFLTGEFGFFYGKLLYTVTQRPGVLPFKKVVLSHVEETKIKATAFTSGEDITFNPRYCKAGNEIFYIVQPRKEGATIFNSNRITGKVEKFTIQEFSKDRRPIFSPAISKDCKKIIFSSSEGGGTNIYSLDRATGELSKLTTTPNAINTSPVFFGDDKKLIFVSDRTGKPKIWEMNVDGTAQKQVLNGEGSYYSPSVSADGKKIAFVRVKAGTFYLGIANLDGTKEENIYSAFLIENPSWAPIGKTILFTSKRTANEKSRIYAVSLNGREPEELPALSGTLNEPVWVDEF